MVFLKLMNKTKSMIQPLGKSSFALLFKKMVNEIIGIHTYEGAGGGRQVQEKTEHRS